MTDQKIDLTAFKELGLSDRSLKALENRGFNRPTPIQALAIPALLNDTKDIVGQAGTGTGKTAAFSLPLLEHLVENAGFLQALIITPTRELSRQVSDEINSLKGDRKISVAVIYGGRSIADQIDLLKKKPDIIVGTPGRIIDHLNRKTISFDRVQYLILDEADEMLDLGFIDDIEQILRHVNPSRRTLLFSATMGREVMKIAEKHMRDYRTLRVDHDLSPAGLTDQIYIEVEKRDIFEALCRILDSEDDFYGLIFCKTKKDVDALTADLLQKGYNAGGLHGDISQGERERTLRAMKSRVIRILVATDVAARGIDITGLTHVINYSLPQSTEAYIHRTGRTGRAGRKGTAITLICPSERRKLTFIQKSTGIEIRRGDVPSPEEIVIAKTKKMVMKLHESIAKGINAHEMEIARELSYNNDPLEVIAAMLHVYHRDTFDTRKYGKITRIKQKEETSSRIIIHRGKADGISARSVRKMIKNSVPVPEHLITGIEIQEHKTFVSIPAEDAKTMRRMWNETDEMRGLLEILSPFKGGNEKKSNDGYKKRASEKKLGSPRRKTVSTGKKKY